MPDLAKRALIAAGARHGAPVGYSPGANRAELMGPSQIKVARNGVFQRKAAYAKDPQFGQLQFKKSGGQRLGRMRPLVGNMGATRQTIEKEHAAPTLAGAVSAASVAILAPRKPELLARRRGGRAHGALGLPHRLNVLRAKDAP